MGHELRSSFLCCEAEAALKLSPPRSSLIGNKIYLTIVDNKQYPVAVTIETRMRPTET